MRASSCSSCKALIVWAVTVNDKPIPIDAKAMPAGNIELEPAGDPREPPIAHVLDKHGARSVNGATRVPMLRYQSHFASCPNAQEHRK